MTGENPNIKVADNIVCGARVEDAVPEEEGLLRKVPTQKERRWFWTLVLVQAQNAFNEKAAQFLLIPLGAWLAVTLETPEDSWLTGLKYILGAMIVLPYILFSPFVGWLSDQFCKARIIQAMAILQVFVLGLMLYCFYIHSIGQAIFWFCIFAIQATVLSPAKKGIVKDIMGARALGMASGIVEMGSVFAILAAQIVAFLWFDSLLASSNDGWHAAFLPTLVFLIMAVPVAVATLFFPRYPTAKPDPFKWSLFYEHFGQLKYLWGQRTLRLSEIGISFFWFLAGVLMLITMQIAETKSGGGAGFGWTAGILMAWLSGGVVFGGLVASRVCRRKIELGLIPLGSIGMSLGCVCLAIFSAGTLGNQICFALTGAFAAIFLVPLNAKLQDDCDHSKRGSVIAAGNLMDCLMGLLAVVVQLWMYNIVPLQGQFVILALLSMGITIISLRLIPREFIRMLGLGIMNLCYRARVIHVNRIPEFGGVILVSNHVTYADALFLSIVSPRPIRFIVAEEFVAIRWLGWILELFDCLPISTRNPRAAITKAIDALKEGEVICIFPEGQLTRTGTLCAARRGIEVLARKANAPIIPVYMDELWGSIFSYERNRFFSKLPHQFPYQFTAAIGEPMQPDNLGAPVVLNTLRKLSAKCISVAAHTGRNEILLRLEEIKSRKLVRCAQGALTGLEIAAHLINDEYDHPVPVLKKWLKLLMRATSSQSNLCNLWINAQQVARVNSLLPHHLLITSLSAKPEPQETVISVLWPILTASSIYLLTTEDKELPEHADQIVGGCSLRTRLQELVARKRIPFYDFSGKSDLVLPNIYWRPCLVNNKGIVLGMSMSHEVFNLDDGTKQLGMRSRTHGKLLPGFYLAKQSNNIVAGPSLSDPFAFPAGMYLDEAGFIAEIRQEYTDSNFHAL